MHTITQPLRILLSFALTAAAIASAGDAHASQPSRSDDAKARLDATLPTLLARKHIASVSIARIEHAKLAFVAAYGEARPGMNATPATRYNIASMTKPISAEVVLRLVAQGAVSLDEPMARYWLDPDLADDPRRDLLTPRLSLSHRSGFANWRRETGGILRFVNPPGETFGYSGEGFEYMARFVENKTGTPFERLAQRWVFGPSGMRESAYTQRRGLTRRMALPTDAEGNTLPPQIATHFFASDDLYSTPRDYARFLIGLMRQDGIDDALAAERIRIQTDRKATLCPPTQVKTCADEAGMGLGWEVFRFGEDRFLMHTGADEGTFTLGYFNPATGSGTVIFTNSSNGAQAVLPILDAIGQDREFVEFLRMLAG